MLSFHYVSIKKIAILYPTFIFQFDSIKIKNYTIKVTID